ncbi:MAG: alpha/beta hydrolase [Mycobacteriales bacterium]
MLAAVLGLAGAVAIIVFWERVGRLWPVRIASLVVVQALALLSIGVAINRQYSLYPRWSDIFGGDQQLTTVAKGQAGTEDAQVKEELAKQKDKHDMLELQVTIPGPRSGLTLPARVFLPPAYNDEHFKEARFPVVEVLSSFPGSPKMNAEYFQYQVRAKEEMDAGRMSPTIIVMPEQNPVASKDSECVNAAGGPQVGTYLSDDVHAYLTTAFRARTDRQGWSAVGFSTGGWCAVQLAVTHPDSYIAAAAVGGYFRPNKDASAALGGAPAALEANDPTRLVGRGGLPSLYLWLESAQDDPEAFHATTNFYGAVKPPVVAELKTLVAGGHNPRGPRLSIPAILDWLSLHMGAPLNPPQVLNLDQGTICATAGSCKSPTPKPPGGLSQPGGVPPTRPPHA